MTLKNIFAGLIKIQQDWLSRDLKEVDIHKEFARNVETNRLNSYPTLYGKNTQLFAMCVSEALKGNEILYSTPKGNIVLRSAENDKKMVEEILLSWVNWDGFDDSDYERNIQEYIESRKKKQC